MKTVTIIQARTTSSRLPGKALLPVAGYASAILAALRAANSGSETVLATSDDASDNELAQQAERQGLTVFRGPLHDVLARYYFASASLSEDATVIRLTADNLVPDGSFVEELAQAFAEAGVDYLSTNASGLPYGLHGEVFSVAALRRAYREATRPFDREHVGPWIVRNWRSASYNPPSLGGSDFSQLRCTIDDQEDYERILRLFESIGDPVNVGWGDLLHKLSGLPGEPKFRVPYRMIGGRVRSAITLGTVQMGMEYGAVNDSGQPSVEQAVAMVRKAVAHGVTALDTARSYGTAEEVLGRALTGAWASRCEVITKINLSDLAAEAPIGEVRARVDESVDRSCEALRRSRLAVLLLHHWPDHRHWNGAAWQRLLELLEAGKIEILGASVYDPEEALEALRDPAIKHLQIPMNVLDWRWEAEGVDQAILARPDVVVHARSALLQGILVHPPERWPGVDGFSAHECWLALRKLAGDFGRESVTDLCLAYVRSLSWITSVVIGCETMQQLEENLRLSRTAKLSPEQCDRMRRELPRAPEKFLDPSKWKTLEKLSATR